ncbi:MAG: hypothetical protein HKN74_03580 [Acidimicrobiia bacterium]|nr:hypothetical protein [Acidimicrobiia bacterium]MBT8215514.1 hypothetical protein [Acidimicrobiia bacterium]NNF09345.1 hypothetical protein [Acidimicrobiia bacterium]NNL71305.1 hypothetical protein [Acidimicrobiia bacterium]
MRRTLKVLGLVGVATATGVAAARRSWRSVHREGLEPPTELNTVSIELRQALHRFEERFGA